MLRIAQLISHGAQLGSSVRAAEPAHNRFAAAGRAHRHGQHGDPGQGQTGPDEGRCGVAETRGDDQPAEPRAEGVGEVERGVVERGAERLGVAGDVHQPHLQAGHEHRAVDRDQEDPADQTAPGVRRSRANAAISATLAASVAASGRDERPVGRQPAERTCPSTPPDTEGQQHQRHAARGHAGHVGRRSGRCSCRRRTCRRSRPSPTSRVSQHLRLPQRTRARPSPGLAAAGSRRHERGHRQHAQQRDHAPRRRTPPASRTSARARSRPARRPVGSGQAEHHAAHRPPALLGRHQATRRPAPRPRSTRRAAARRRTGSTASSDGKPGASAVASVGQRERTPSARPAAAGAAAGRRGRRSAVRPRPRRGRTRR